MVAFLDIFRRIAPCVSLDYCGFLLAVAEKVNLGAEKIVESALRHGRFDEEEFRDILADEAGFDSFEFDPFGFRTSSGDFAWEEFSRFVCDKIGGNEKLLLALIANLNLDELAMVVFDIVFTALRQRKIFLQEVIYTASRFGSINYNAIATILSERKGGADQFREKLMRVLSNKPRKLTKVVIGQVTGSSSFNMNGRLLEAAMTSINLSAKDVEAIFFRR